MPLSAITATTKKELVKKLIEFLMKEGKPQKQAIAIALEEARRRGLDSSMVSPSSGIYTEPISLGNVQKLNGIWKVPVILARQMVQMYHRSEIPFFDDVLPEDIQWIPVLKDYEELKKGVPKITQGWIPWVIPHTEGTFLPDLYPFSKDEASRETFIKDGEVRGKVKDIVANDTEKSIKGNVYLKPEKHEQEWLDMIDKGEIMNVSIGFSAYFDFDPGEYEGQEYWLVQRDFYYGHLAGLPNHRGKCPAGLCGLGMDQINSPVRLPSKIQTIPPLSYKNSFLGYIDHKPSILITSTDSGTHSDPQSSLNGLINNTMPMVDQVEPNLKEHIIMPTIEELQKELSVKDAELAKVKDSVSATKIKELESKAHDAEIKMDMLTSEIKNKDAEIAKIKEECKKSSEDLQKYKDAERMSIIAELKPIYKGQRKLEDMCLHDLKVAIDFAKERSADAIIQSGLPKLGDSRVDPNTIPIIPSTTVDINQILKESK